MQNSDGQAGTLSKVLDLNQLRAVLKEIRGKEAMKKFAKRIGIHWGKVQRFENGAQSIWAEDLAAWLEGSGSSMAEFFAQRASSDQLAKITKDKDLAEKIRMALTIPRKRKALKAALGLIFPDEK